MQEEAEVFEINDFTTASDWERFISNFEEVIRDWGLASKGTNTLKRRLKSKELHNGLWIEKSETLKFSKAVFTANLFYLKLNQEEDGDKTKSEETKKLPVAIEDSVHCDNDFPSRAHCIARWYGLREFIIISPTGNTESISSEDKSKLLISSAAIALNNTQSQVPVFIQINQRNLRQFQGICTNSELTCYYDMTYFNKVPGKYGYLSELFGLYKEKLECPIKILPPSNISARFTHIIGEWPNDWLFCEGQIDIDSPPLEITQAIDFVCYEDPIKDFQLYTTWQALSEELVTDSPFHSDLNPLQAPFWSIRVTSKDNPATSLNETLLHFYNLSNSPSKNQQVLGKMIEDIEKKEADMEVRQALDRMTNPNLSINLPQLGKSKLKPGLPYNVKDILLRFIFDLIEEEKVDNPHLNDYKSFKSAPYDSLAWRIALTLAFVNVAYKDLTALAYMWREIISELRRLWEKCTSIPRVVTGPPDVSTCLFSQKLQMLNCCIQQKIKRETLKQPEGEEFETSIKTQTTISDEEDEFFDAEESIIIKEKPVAEGRLAPLEDLKLVSNNEPLYVPITQDPAPLTEDMIQEQADILFQLGTTIEGAALRTKMQSAGLFSDMEAFKAANPGAILEDFVRWYSPRDYADGELSHRMNLAGNAWRDCWDNAQAVPVQRQKRLFDYTKEAEKVLHYLASITLGDIVNQVMPFLIQSAACQFIRERDIKLTNDELPIRLSEIIQCYISGNHFAALSLIREAEVKLFKIQSITRKLTLSHELEFSGQPFDWDTVKQLILSLVAEPETQVSGGPNEYIGRLIKGLFKHSAKVLYEEKTPVAERNPDTLFPELSEPFAKEFILRVNLPRPAVYSQSLPQRMYCLISPNEFRVCGSFSEDSVYF